MCSLSVVPFDMQLQFDCPDEASITSVGRACVRTVVVMNHRVTGQIYLKLERLATALGLALEWPLTGMNPLVIRKMVRLRKSCTTTCDLALEWPFTRMNPFVLSDTGRSHLFAALPEPAEHLAVLEPLPLWSPGLARWSRWRAGSL
jgi:hypothetical protein